MPATCDECLYHSQDDDLCRLVYASTGRYLKLPHDRACVAGEARG